MGKRTFEELSVVATGVQSLEDRFGKRRRHDYEDLPTVSQWRCNLTGLSQEHNLYFVAYGRDIYVYVAQYPTQAVPERPILVVPSTPSRRGLSGYLDRREPHSINNLLIHHLGNDEVVATVRDDGDVEIVLVRHILQAIKRRAEQDSTIGVEADEVRPIFLDNVGISAWGLAIHTEGRILTTSSNAHEVRVFKFGLLHEEAQDPNLLPSPDVPPYGPSDASTASTTPGNASAARSMDVTQRVLNGDANIPYISFCNTGDDPEGRWLLTTDIHGYCRVMDLHCRPDAHPSSQQFRFGRSFITSDGGLDRLNAGWGIMFLDRRSFRPEHSLNTALGLSEDESLPGSAKGTTSRCWDLSDTVDNVPNNSTAFMYNEPKKQRREARRERQTSEVSMANSEIVADDDEPNDELSVDGGVPLEPQSQQDVIEMLVDEFVSQTAEQLDDNSTTFDDDPFDDDLTADEGNDPDDHDEEIALVEDDADPEDEGTEDTISYASMYGGRRVFGNQPYFYQDTTLCEGLPCPILHASVKNIYLLQPSNRQGSEGPFSSPMVGLANPLRQSIQSHFGYLNMFDRLNMNAYIPSLGVVVLASQKGRAAVLSLTKLSSGADLSQFAREHRAPKSIYAMRLECILPFANQEMKNQRPFAPLHGIAAGPLPGTKGLLEDGKKRWRLMMMYQDHSILSYEIKRPRARDSAVDVGGLVV